MLSLHWPGFRPWLRNGRPASCAVQQKNKKGITHVMQNQSFKKYNSVAFSSFAVLYNQPLCLVAERFRHPRRNRCSHCWSPPSSVPAPALSPWTRRFWTLCTRGTERVSSYTVRGPQGGERSLGHKGLGFSRRRKRQTSFFFPSTFLSLNYTKHIFL